jgi:hypothetical protein
MCLFKRTINKVIANNNRKNWVKDMEGKQARKATNAQGVATRTIQKIANRITKAKFVDVWFITTIKTNMNLVPLTNPKRLPCTSIGIQRCQPRIWNRNLVDS